MNLVWFSWKMAESFLSLESYRAHPRAFNDWVREWGCALIWWNTSRTRHDWARGPGSQIWGEVCCVSSDYANIVTRDKSRVTIQLTHQHRRSHYFCSRFAWPGPCWILSVHSTMKLGSISPLLHIKHASYKFLHSLCKLSLILHKAYFNTQWSGSLSTAFPGPKVKRKELSLLGQPYEIFPVEHQVSPFYRDSNRRVNMPSLLKGWHH